MLDNAALQDRKPPTIIELVDTMAANHLNIGFDIVANEPFKTGPLPWDCTTSQRPWTDTDDNRLYALLQELVGLKSKSDMLMALDIAAKDRSFDPLRQMIESFSWDGTPRAETIFTDCLGAEDEPYTRAAARVFLCEAMERVFRPGSKADYLPILAGPGGIGKSTFCRSLAVKDRFFSDCLTNMGDVKSTGELNRGKWIIELPELAGMSDRNLEAVKASVTRQYDEFRGAYCRRTESFPRRVVYIGTTNEADFIRDQTSGARRFLPIQCGVLNPATPAFSQAFSHAVTQIWAEVREWRESKDPRFATVLSPEMEEEAAKQRMCFMAEDPNVELINAYLNKSTDHLICTFEILDNVLHLSRDRKNCADVSKILSTQCPGWVPAKKRKCGDYGKQRCWEFRGL